MKQRVLLFGLFGKRCLQGLIAACLLMVFSHRAYAGPEPDLNPTPSVPETVAGCPDYQAVIGLPSFNFPQKKPFNRWQSRWWSRHHSPYHMVHDEMVNPGNAVTMVGKFDYSRAWHKDLEKEYIHAYLIGSGINQWQYLGKYKTDRDGKVYVPIAGKPAGEYLIRMVVEGDLSVADGFLSVVPKGQQTILFDIDGTLTLSDFEQVGDYLGVSTAQSWPYAIETVQAYIDKGYRVIFVTGRPYWIARDTREWFTRKMNIPQWHLRTNNDGGSPLSYDTETYKREYLTRLVSQLELDIVRAYGNASTDISAYFDAGIAKENTWIIGKNAGQHGTNPIDGDYGYHYSTRVLNADEASCRN